MATETLHLLDERRGRYNVRRCWAVCSAPRLGFPAPATRCVTRSRQLVTCRVCLLIDALQTYVSLDEKLSAAMGTTLGEDAQPYANAVKVLAKARGEQPHGQ